MILRMVKCLIISAIVISFSACGTCPAHVDVPLAPRPVFTEYSDELWSQIPLEAKENITFDDLAMKKYIRRTEERARIHNE